MGLFDIFKSQESKDREEFFKTFVDEFYPGGTQQYQKEVNDVINHFNKKYDYNVIEPIFNLSSQALYRHNYKEIADLATKTIQISTMLPRKNVFDKVMSQQDLIDMSILIFKSAINKKRYKQ